MANPANAVANGFFGCLGVLGAIVASIVVLVTLSMCHHQASVAEADNAWATLDARAICGQWTRAAEARYDLKDVTLTREDPIVAGHDPASLTCFATAANRKGKLRLEVSVSCPNAGNTECSMLQDAWLNDRKLKID